jgi:hypothetical protein
MGGIGILVQEVDFSTVLTSASRQATFLIVG